MSVENQVLEIFKREFSEQLTEPPTLDSPLLNSDGGPLDSLGVQLLLVTLETELDTELSDEDIAVETFKNVRSLAAVLEKSVTV